MPFLRGTADWVEECRHTKDRSDQDRHHAVMGVPDVSVRRAYADMSRAVSGPGWPLPIGRPSTATTGDKSPMVPVTKTSSAV